MSYDAVSPEQCLKPEEAPARPKTVTAAARVGKRSARRCHKGKEEHDLTTRQTRASTAGDGTLALQPVPPVCCFILYEASLEGRALCRRPETGLPYPAAGVPGLPAPPAPGDTGRDPAQSEGARRASSAVAGHKAVRERRSASLTAEIVNRMLIDAEGPPAAKKRGPQCRASGKSLPDRKRGRHCRGDGQDGSIAAEGANYLGTKVTDQLVKSLAPKPCPSAQKPTPGGGTGKGQCPQLSALSPLSRSRPKLPPAIVGHPATSEPQNCCLLRKLMGKLPADPKPTGPPNSASGRKPQATRRKKKTENEHAGRQCIGQCLSTNKWRPVGQSLYKMVYVLGASKKAVRKCYRAVKRDKVIIHVRDTVLLRSEMNKRSLPHVAKISALWENPETGDLTMSLMWYYRPKQIETMHNPSYYCENELFASRHKDVNSVACIEEKCFVLTFSEYCRFRARLRSREQRVPNHAGIVPSPLRNSIPRHRRVPEHTDQELVFFCRNVYDFLRGQVVKNFSG